MPGIMLAAMTIYGRNAFFRVEILIAAGFLILAGALVFTALPGCSAAMEEAVKRSAGLVQGLLARLEPSPLAPLVSLSGAALFSLAALVCIHFFFEKTQAPEILFVSLFVFSFSFEIMRLITPLQKIWNLPSLYPLLASRTLLFGRFFGIFSLFAASVCAAGMEIQKHLNVILAVAFVSLVIALGIPIDILTWDSSFSMINGYPSLIYLMEAAVLLITVLSFFISAWSRGAPEYAAVGLGSLIVFTGRNILFSADTLISPLPGLFLLAAGEWLISTKLHRVYLWL
ncbi:MAG: hypothetical protein LBH51_07890 [Treponema sp.]|jgi:hypothetical protein|nr:hypothetical protein [Treponema sp.]